MMKKTFGYVFIAFVILLILSLVSTIPQSISLLLDQSCEALNQSYIFGRLFGNFITIVFAIWLYKLGRKWITEG